RCRLGVVIDGVDRPDVAEEWTQSWQGVFIAGRADLTVPATATGRLSFGYAASQGDFALDLAADRCVLLDGPATVENIAEHIAKELALRYFGHLVKVRAYEGVGKG